MLSLASEETDTSVRLQRKKNKSFLPFSKVRRPTIIFKQNDMNTPHKSKHTNPFLTAPSIFFSFSLLLECIYELKKVKPSDIILHLNWKPLCIVSHLKFPLHGIVLYLGTRKKILPPDVGVVCTICKTIIFQVNAKNRKNKTIKKPEEKRISLNVQPTNKQLPTKDFYPINLTSHNSLNISINN